MFIPLAVYLNTCYSKEQASIISKHIDFVIGMSGDIEEEAALKFSCAFYDELLVGEAITWAFDLGLNAIDMNDLKGKAEPLLMINREEHKR